MYIAIIVAAVVGFLIGVFFAWWDLVSLLETVGHKRFGNKLIVGYVVRFNSASDWHSNFGEGEDYGGRE